MRTTIFGITLIVSWILYVGFAVAIDTVFGLGRAIKQRCWNSSFGINGAIRKVCQFNLIKMFHADIIKYLSAIGITHVGFSEFFGILFVAYECVSILKNMYFCGLPVKWVWAKVYRFLHKYTNELPDTEDIDLQ